MYKSLAIVLYIYGFNFFSINSNISPLLVFTLTSQPAMAVVWLYLEFSSFASNFHTKVIDFETCFYHCFLALLFNECLHYIVIGYKTLF